LLIDPNIEIQPLIRGGAQQRSARAGTEPVALAVGMEVAFGLWAKNRSTWLERLRGLQRLFELRLLEHAGQVVVNGRDAARLPHTSNISFPGLDRQVLLIGLDQRGIECSSGSACSSGSSQPSHVLRAMACDRALIDSSLRFSFSPATTPAEVELAAERIGQFVGQLRALA
jgi:cysteine desulfurase